MHEIHAALALVLLAAVCFADETTQEPPVFDVPQLPNHKPGEPWGDQGFRVDLMPDVKGIVRSDFDSRFRVGWNDEGLLLLIAVRSPAFVEADKLDELWARDSFEVYMAQRPGAAEYCQALVSPGCDAAHPDVRTTFNPAVKAPLPPEDLRIAVQRRKTAGGYEADVLFPWKDLKLTPKAGDRVALQVMVNRYDERARSATYHALWFPAEDASRNSNSLHVIRLSDHASPPVGFTATAEYERFSDIRLVASAGECAVGRKVAVSAGGKPLIEIALQAKDGRAFADALFPMPEPGAPTLPLEVALDGRPVKTLKLADADAFRAEALAGEKMAFESFCFGTRTFPKCDFERPALVEKLIGRYTIKAAFVDADGIPVTVAEKPGRYAAIVDVFPANGRALRRFSTLYRCADGFDPRRAPGETTLKLASGYEIDAAVAEKHGAEVNAYLRSRFADSLARDAGSAVLLACLHDLGAARPYAAAIPDGNLALIERQWWINFKRRYYGMDKVYAAPFVCPVSVAGAPAPTIRSGSLADAGMKPDAADKLDALCKEWLKAADQPFSLCLVRHGVIFFDKGYGERDGKAMTTTTPTPLASSGKFMASILMMELVDQGLVDVDKTIDTYIPALRGVPCRKQPTVRDLYLHVTGMPEHLRESLSDLEEIVAGFYPCVPASPKQSYQGTGLALGAKIVEAISGEVHPAYWQRHLLGPLGCEATKPGGPSGGGMSNSREYATIGQMMLNGGAYGKWRFLRPETVRQYAPQPGRDRIGPDKKIRWGIGTKLYDSDGLSAKAFGHPGAFGEFVMVDPERDLVAAMHRWDEGKDYLAFRARMFAAVYESIADAPIPRGDK